MPLPVISTPAQNSPSADATISAIVPFDTVRTPRLLVEVRTVAAFSFCCARAICSSIV
ncbi:hypothetical protein TPA0907_07090 [Micromonospora humidisoli]|nr:hypothetical protein TPA0907_07090 [Micromonospora sp. AKA109]